MRDIYEVPAAEIILTAHKELEKLVGTIHQNNFKPDLDRHWAFLVYAGLWYEPLLGDLNAFMDSVNERVTGTITMRLYKGSAPWRSPARRRTRSTTQRWPASASRAGSSASRPAPASSSYGPCRAAWRIVCETGKAGSRERDVLQRHSVTWSGGSPSPTCGRPMDAGSGSA